MNTQHTLTGKMLYAAYSQAYKEYLPAQAATLPAKPWGGVSTLRKLAYIRMADILNEQLRAAGSESSESSESAVTE